MRRIVKNETDDERLETSREEMKQIVKEQKLIEARNGRPIIAQGKRVKNERRPG